MNALGQTAALLALNAKLDATLTALGAELAACDALKEACSDGEVNYEALYNQHWDLREKIHRIPVTTLVGLRVKAMAAEFALKWD
jgi:hypothetical protein